MRQFANGTLLGRPLLLECPYTPPKVIAYYILAACISSCPSIPLKCPSCCRPSKLTNSTSNKIQVAARRGRSLGVIRLESATHFGGAQIQFETKRWDREQVLWRPARARFWHSNADNLTGMGQEWRDRWHGFMPWREDVDEIIEKRHESRKD